MIFAVMMVRNERDILPVNLRYHLDSGIDHILVADNGSTDGTTAILEEFAATNRVHVFARPGPSTRPTPRPSSLARRSCAVRDGYCQSMRTSSGTSRTDVFATSWRMLPTQGRSRSQVVNFVQRREQEALDVRGLLTMTRRVPAPVGASGEAADLVESGRIAFVEIRYPPKYVSRACIALQIGQGNHEVSGTDGPVRQSGAIVCLHAPLRARDALAIGKVEQGRRVEEINHYLQQAWHVRRWRRLADEGAIDAEWAANSYREDSLDVYGQQHPLAIDTTLRDVVAPWIEAAAEQNVGRPFRAARVDGRQSAALHLSETKLDPARTAGILDRMRQVEGCLKDNEAELLIVSTRRAVKEHGVATVVEIGSYCGKSTIVLASAARTANAGARVYAVDPHQGVVGSEDGLDTIAVVPHTFERFQRNITAAGLSGDDRADPPALLRSPVASPIAFLFIDGLHGYSNVTRDLLPFRAAPPGQGLRRIPRLR